MSILYTIEVPQPKSLVVNMEVQGFLVEKREHLSVKRNELRRTALEKAGETVRPVDHRRLRFETDYVLVADFEGKKAFCEVEVQNKRAAVEEVVQTQF